MIFLLECAEISLITLDWFIYDLSWDEKAKPLNRRNKPDYAVGGQGGNPAIIPRNLQSCSPSFYIPLPPPAPTDKAKKKLGHHYMNPSSFRSSCHFNMLCPIFFLPDGGFASSEKQLQRLKMCIHQTKLSVNTLFVLNKPSVLVLFD